MTPEQSTTAEDSPTSPHIRTTSPKNHQFDDLRQTWKLKFDRASLPSKPRASNSESSSQPSEAAPAQPLELSTRARVRICALLDTRAAIEDLASTHTQRTAFAEWLQAEALRRPGETISGRSEDPRRLPTCVQVSVARRTPLYEFQLPRGYALTRGDSFKIAIDGETHRTVVHSIAAGRVTLALADVNRPSIADAALIGESSMQLGEGKRVTGTFRYVFAVPEATFFASGTTVEFRDRGVRVRGQVVDFRGKAAIVETSEKLPHAAKSGALIEVRNWEDYYSRVRELRYATFGSRFSHTTINELWKSFPDSKAAKFMRAFARGMDFAFPHLDIHGKLPAFFTRIFFDRCSLLPYLVCAELLPSKLLSDLKLVVWPPQRLSGLQVLAMKSEPRVIAGIKMIFEAARWLKYGERRILVVEPPLEGTRNAYGEADDIDPSIIGSILYLREKIPGGQTQGNPTEFEPERITVQFFPTLYEAHRRNPHASEQYDEELPLQTEYRAEAQEINQRITRDWSVDQATRDKLTEELKDFADRWSTRFENADHRLKQELYDLLQGIVERIPVIRHRIGPIQTKLVATIIRADKRNNELPRIAGAMATDQRLLKKEIDDGEQRISIVRDRVLEAASIFESSETELFGQERTTTEQQAVVRKFMAHSRLNLSALNGIRCRPFTVFADKLRAGFSDFERALIERNRESAKDSLIKLLVITKLAHTNAVFQELKFRVSFDSTVSLAQLATCLADLETLLAERAVFPEREVTAYSQAYQQTQTEAAQLAQTLKEHHTDGLTLDARTGLFRTIRTLLDEIDIESRIRAL